MKRHAQALQVIRTNIHTFLGGMRRVQAAEYRLHSARNSPHENSYGALVLWHRLGRFRPRGDSPHCSRARRREAGRGQLRLVGENTVQKHALLVLQKVLWGFRNEVVLARDSSEHATVKGVHTKMVDSACAREKHAHFSYPTSDVYGLLPRAAGHRVTQRANSKRSLRSG